MVGQDASYSYADGFRRGVVRFLQDVIFLDNRRETKNKDNKVMT